MKIMSKKCKTTSKKNSIPVFLNQGLPPMLPKITEKLENLFNQENVSKNKDIPGKLKIEFCEVRKLIKKQI